MNISNYSTLCFNASQPLEIRPMQSRFAALFTTLALALSLSVHAAESRGGVATVAVAANFAAPMQQLAPAFTRATGHELRISTGATGKFYAQIVNGAPFDVLLAADDETPAKLVREKHAVAGTTFTYATGKLVLWSAKTATPVALKKQLETGAYRYLSVANPKTAPYGRAAVETLAALKLAVPAAKTVTGESIAQTFQFVATGNADLGFVALAQVWQDGAFRHGAGWIVPAALHAPIKQDTVLLQRGVDNAAARALLAYLKAPAAQAVIRAYGYAD